MRRFEQKRVPIEVMLVKLCEGAPLKPLAEVLEVLKASPVPVPAPVTPTAAEPTLPRKTARRRADEERDEPDTEDLPPPDAEIAPAAKRGGPAPGETASSFEALWQPLLSAVKSEKISLASYLAEGEPSGLRNGVARIAFPERHSFHRETLELPDNRRLIEKHLSQLLGQAVRIEFESVKEIRGGGEGPAKSPDTPAAASQEILKSASNLFGGKVIH
jgi:DNA polymerase-3 subunit gamma/tau